MRLEHEQVSRPAATRLSATVLAFMLTACGGSSAYDSAQFLAGSTTADTMEVSADTRAAPTLITLGDLAYVDPAPLSQLMAMSDADFQMMLSNEWPRVQKLLHDYIAPGVAFDFPTPMGFIGPWQSCMTQHTTAACREHINQLISLMNSKAPR